MKEIAGKFFNRSQKTDRGDFTDVSVANYSNQGISRRNFVKIVGLAGLGVLAGCVSTSPKVTGPNYVNYLRKGDPNTMNLPNGEVIYNISGEWEGTYNNYGYGTNDEIVRIEQTGNEFIGRKKIGNQWVDAGNETIMGRLMKDGFEETYSFDHQLGWQKDSYSVISSNGNEIVIRNNRCEKKLKRQ